MAARLRFRPVGDRVTPSSSTDATEVGGAWHLRSRQCLCAFLCGRTQAGRAPDRSILAAPDGGPGSACELGGTVPIDELEGLPVAWTPPPGAFAASPAGRMAARCGITDAREFLARAAADPEWYWAAGMADLGIPWMRPYETVLDLSRGAPHPRFFVGGQLNWADFAVDRWVREGRGTGRAVWWEGDDGATRTLTYAELKAEVDAAAGALRAAGTGRGDVVALLLPMVPEAIATVLAAARIGAVVVPLFSGYGALAVRARLADSGASVLVTC